MLLANKAIAFIARALLLLCCASTVALASYRGVRGGFDSVHRHDAAADTIVLSTNTVQQRKLPAHSCLEGCNCGAGTGQNCQGGNSIDCNGKPLGSITCGDTFPCFDTKSCCLQDQYNIYGAGNSVSCGANSVKFKKSRGSR